jgi:hypothetical protein
LNYVGIITTQRLASPVKKLLSASIKTQQDKIMLLAIKEQQNDAATGLAN